MTVWDLKQFFWWSKLSLLSVWHHKDFIRVHDCINPVSNCDHCARLKLISNCLLYQLISAKEKGRNVHQYLAGNNGAPIRHLEQYIYVWCGCSIKTYFLSTLAVASSMRRILLLLRMARARQNSCFCPTLKLLPPSTTLASNPSLNSLTESSSWTCRREYMTCYICLWYA